MFTVNIEKNELKRKRRKIRESIFLSFLIWLILLMDSNRKLPELPNFFEKCNAFTAKSVNCDIQ